MRALGPLDFLPLWALFAVTLALVLLAIDARFRFGRQRAAPAFALAFAAVFHLIADLDRLQSGFIQ